MKRMMSDVFALFRSYEDSYFFPEFLQKLSETSNLMRETESVKDKLRCDVFDLFEKDEVNDLIGDGAILKSSCNVSSIQRVSTPDYYLVDACVDIRAPGEDLVVPELSASKFGGTGGKKRLREKVDAQLVQLWFRFEEVKVGSRHRDVGTPVLDTPCKVITMTIRGSRCAAALDMCLLAEMRMFTAADSPSDTRFPIPPEISMQLARRSNFSDEVGTNEENSDGNAGCESQHDADTDVADGNSTGSKISDSSGQEHGHEDIGEDGDDRSDESNGDENDNSDQEHGHDTADYYSITVNKLDLQRVASWIESSLSLGLARQRILPNCNNDTARGKRQKSCHGNDVQPHSPAHEVETDQSVLHSGVSIVSTSTGGITDATDVDMTSASKTFRRMSVLSGLGKDKGNDILRDEVEAADAQVEKHNTNSTSKTKNSNCNIDTKIDTKAKKHSTVTEHTHDRECDNDSDSDGGEHMLLFLLSFPFVDCAWDIHDLILDSAYPMDGDGDSDSEEGSGSGSDSDD